MKVSGAASIKASKHSASSGAGYETNNIHGELTDTGAIVESMGWKSQGGDPSILTKWVNILQYLLLVADQVRVVRLRGYCL